MSGFQLDTSGVVRAHEHWAEGDEVVRWTDLTPFAQGYVEAMFAGLFDTAASLGEWVAHIALSEGVQREPRFSDLAPATLARIVEDCERWSASSSRQDPDARSGRDFWAIRQRPNPYGFPPLTLHLADDGLIYLRAAA